MIYSNYPFTLDIHGVVSQISFPVSLNDTARSLLISLTDGGRPYEISHGCRAVLAAVKPDGARLLNDCIIVGNKIIRYDFTPQTASFKGKIDCEVRLYGEDGNLVTSPRFTIVVYEGLLDERIVSEDEKTTINNMLVAEQLRVAAENERVAAEAEREEVAKRAEAAADRVKESLNGDRVYIRYSAYPDGEGYVSEWARGLNYIGVAAGLDEPTDKSGYEWSIFAPTVYVGSGDMPDYADIQIDPDGEYIDDSTPQLKGYATGNIVRLEDVAQEPQELRVKVEGRNLLPYPFEDTTKTDGGVTYTDNGDGTITLNGTYDGNGSEFILGEITIKESGNYFLSGCPAGGGTYNYILYAMPTRGYGDMYIDGGVGCGFYANAGDTLKVMITPAAASAGTVYDGLTFKPQLELGEKTEFCPPFGCTTVVASGKNLFDGTILSGYFKNVNGGLEGSTLAKFKSLLLDLPKGTYTLSFGVAAVIIRTIIDGKYDSAPVGVTNIKTYTFTTNGGKVGFSFKRNDDTAWVVNTPIQIEIGSKATEYEPFTGSKYTPSDDGNVEGVASIYPTTVLATTNGAVLNVEYDRDLGRVISNLESIVDTLLGG